MNKQIIGIDPGKNGAIVCMQDGIILLKDVMPLIGTELDMQQLSTIIGFYKGTDVHVFVEDVHAIFGSAAGATFTFGGVFYAIQQCLVDFKIPYTLVQPKVWQKVAYQGIPEIRKAPILIKKGKRAGQSMLGKRDCKRMSELAAKRLFPDVDFRASERCRISHDGIIDATLIAYYGARR